MTIRIMETGDLAGAAEVHADAFTRQTQSQQWLECNLNAAPRFLCYVCEEQGKIIGYIIWAQKSGFRPEAVMEIEQLAVHPEHQCQGVGRRLINESLPLVRQALAEQDSVLKHVIVSTRADNHAQKLYRDTLDAEVEATLTNLYSADEVLMVARHVQPCPLGVYS